MKKIVVLFIVILTIGLILCGCQIGNRRIGIDMTQTFKWAIIQLGNGELIEGPVSSWRDFEEGDEVQITINGVTYLTHYSNVILATDRP